VIIKGDKVWTMAEIILMIAISGLLTGGIYALIAMGLSLQYGVARVLNIAHGEFIMLGALIIWALVIDLRIYPPLALAIAGPALFGMGFLLYRTLFTSIKNRAPTLGAAEGNALLAAFGLYFVILNSAVVNWGALPKAYEFLESVVWLGGTAYRLNRLVALVIAVVAGVAFYLFLTRSRTGKAIRAAAQDPATAGLMGVNINRMLPLCFGLGAFLACLAAFLVGITTTVNAFMGLRYTIIAIIVMVLGGLGSIPGSFIGGFILGIVGSIVNYFEPTLTLPAFYAIFMILILVRPTGLFGQRQQ
jgi:branched-chain amino acid transport system permease protein